MVIKVIGWVLLISGVLVLIFPGILRWQIRRKSNRVIRRCLFAIALFPATLIIAAGFRFEGVMPKIIMVIGLFLLVKAVFSIRSKAVEKIVDFLKKQPTIFFRLCAFAQALIGLAIVWFA
jgi:hypothetical protein